MALVLRKLYNGYFWLFNDMADPRTNDLFFSSPIFPTSVILIYLYFVQHLGPKLMKNRKPFNIVNLIRIYNILQIFVNAYMTVCSMAIIYKSDWRCRTVDYTNSPLANFNLHVGYFYLGTKFLDLLDTVFFVLRKSFRQISFLHVYHHCLMVFFTWVGLRFVGGGENIWLPALNGFVHCILYLYYFLATIDDKWKDVKYKKIITQIQLGQFIALLIVYGRILFKSDCLFPKWVSYVLVTQDIFMIFLFSDFYVKTYLRKDKNK